MLVAIAQPTTNGVDGHQTSNSKLNFNQPFVVSPSNHGRAAVNPMIAITRAYSSQGIRSSPRPVRLGPSWPLPANAGSGRSAVLMLPSLNITPSSQ